MNRMIVLDPGHGGTDPGAAALGRVESRDTLLLAHEVRRQLTALGYVVMMTREGDRFVSPNSRRILANGSGADLLISLHRGCSRDAEEAGNEVWISAGAGAVEEAAAVAVMNGLSVLGQGAVRGIKKGDVPGLEGLAMPSLLLQAGFLSNPDDNRLFEEAHLEEYARAVTRGIRGVFGEAAGSPAEPELFKVQVGAFRVESNARAFLQQVRRMGLDAFLIAQEPGCKISYGDRT